MKYLFVGDPHVTPDSIEECERLLELVKIHAESPDKPLLVFLGDLYHTHASIRVEVLNFWNKWLGYLGNKLGKDRVIALVGNHDKPGNAAAPNSLHSLLAHKDLVTIVDSPVVIDGVGYMPYMASPEEFVEEANKLGTEVLICHQTFIGANYENNFPAPDGADINRITQRLIVSGHIHMRQELLTKRGQTIYPGAPRWMTVSDANQEKGLMVGDITVEPFNYKFDYISTHGTCKMLRSLEVNPTNFDKLAYLKLHKEERFIITMKGPRTWVKENIDSLSKFLDSSDSVLKTVYTDDLGSLEVKESEGLAKSLKKFVYAKQWEISQEQLWKEVTTRINWLSNQPVG